MPHHSEPDDTRACCWVAGLIERAWPETAGITLAALEALKTQDSFTPAQVAYIAQLMMYVGAQARTAGDRAELEASWRAHFRPAPTRAERIAVRRGPARPEDHQGGPAAVWDADRPDGDFGPPATAWHRDAGIPVRRLPDQTWAWRYQG